MENTHFECLIRHVRHVQKNMCRIAEKEEKKGNLDFARLLIKNSFLHDQSKFKAPEWYYLVIERDLISEDDLKKYVSYHNTSNPHHPEYWFAINDMSDEYVAEMVCDWKARSEEFGSSFFEWINESATKRYGFTKDDEIYKRIMYYAEMLVDPPLKPLKDV